MVEATYEQTNGRVVIGAGMSEQFRHISKKLKGRLLGACVTPAMLYGLETLPVSEKHQHRLQVCENNWVRRIAGVKRVDRRRMDELRRLAYRSV